MPGTTSHTQSANTLLRGLEPTEKWSETTLTYIFPTAANASTVNSNVPTGAGSVFNPIDTETQFRNSILAAMTAYSNVANLNFSATTDFTDADIKFTGFDNLISAGGSGIEGRMDFPGDNLKFLSLFDYETYMALNMTSAAMNLAEETGGGGFNRSVIIHELGHGLGLAHPHDTGGGSTAWAALSRGPGDNKADNERYTVMSYEAGGFDQDNPRSYGHAVTPSALDIAALHAMYGARSGTNSGNTTYRLGDAGGVTLDVAGADGAVSIARAFYTIWDTGGDADEIRYVGAKNVYINLNDATLVQTDDAATTEQIDQIKKFAAYGDLPKEIADELTLADYHAGGFYSRTFDAAKKTDLGGYAIANGVTIERGTAGGGDDFLIGNEAANRLSAGGGDDAAHGGAGNDTLIGGAGDDELMGGRGDDRIEGGSGEDIAVFIGRCDEYSITRDDDTGVITVSHRSGGADGTDTLIDVERARFSDSEMDLTAEELSCGPLDFIFLVDLSGSFFDDLANFRAAARSIADSVRETNPEARFAIASFVDRPVSPFGSPGDYLYRPELALTDSIADFEATLDGLSTLNGGDFPEAQWVGLYRAAQGVGLDLREDSRKIIYLATDASAHDAASYGLSEAEIQDFLDSEGIDVAGREIKYDLPGADDPDGDVSVEPPREIDDGLVERIRAALIDTGATPILGVSGGAIRAYEAALDEFGRGVAVPVAFDSRDVADAVRAALAEIDGAITESGTAFADTLTGSDSVQDVLFGLGGNDLIRGLGRSDILDGGAGNDSIEGGSGNDILRGGTDNDTLDGGSGSDFFAPGTGSDLVILGAGRDIVSGAANELDGDTIQGFGSDDALRILGVPGLEIAIAPSGSGSTLSFDADGTGPGTALATISFDTDLSGFDFRVVEINEDRVVASAGFAVRGTGASDRIEGDDGPNRISAQSGADTVNGGDGDDRIFGNDGDDVILGGDGDDVIKSGDGDDSAAGNLGDDIILSGDGDDTIEGGAGDDIVKPGRGNDVIDGGGGSDIVRGFRGDERISGGSGNDTLLGGLDDDTIEGGAGDDRLGGGPGRDRFVFAEREFGDDRIVDFRIGSDELDFRGSGLSLADFSFTQAGGNVLVSIAGTSASLVLGGVDADALEAAATDFLF